MSATGRLRGLGVGPGPGAPRARRRRDAGATAVGGVLGVAAALRAGASPAVAWWRGWGLRAPDGVPDPGDVRARCGDPGHAAAVVAAARLAARTGAPLAAVLERTAAALAEEADVEVQRRAALAGPRATVHVLTWLPAVGVLLGTALGADPLGVLLDVPGALLAVAAAVLTWAGARWSGALVRRARSAGRERVAEALPGAAVGRGAGVGPRVGAGPGAGAGVEVDVVVVLDLLDAACAAGCSVPGALAAVAEAVGGRRGDALARVARALGAGAGWAEAWGGSDAVDAGRRRGRRARSGHPGGTTADLAPVAAALRPSWEDGVAPGGALRATAAHIRRERRAEALDAAGRLGVRLVLPLGVCHLPAFVLVGLVPVLVSVAGGAAG